VKTEHEDPAIFRAECERWQRDFGLLHWTLQFKVSKATPDGQHEAETDFDCETRHAVVTYNVGVEDALHPADVALHEMLHLLVADMVLAAIEAGRAAERRGDKNSDAAEADPVLGREEHKAIEVLIKIIPRKARK